MAKKRNSMCKLCSVKQQNQIEKKHEIACNGCGKVRKYAHHKEILKCKSCSTKEQYVINPSKNKGHNNPMFKRGYLNVWKEKYDIHVLNEKIDNLSQVRSNNAAGCKNGMFGKPSPTKAGKGISGKYKNIHFRSLLELAFLEWFEINFNELPVSAELNIYKMPYINQSGTLSNYFPDFYYKDIIYEIKPSKLVNFNDNKIKIEKAKTYFKNYKIITEKDLPNYKNIKTRLKDFKELTIYR